jgi:lysozyme
MNLVDVLKREEAFVPYAYKDSLGYWTIGYGQLIDKGKGGGISEAAGLFMMQERIDQIRQSFVTLLPWFKKLDEVRSGVLIAMAYQMGVSGVLLFRNTLEAVRTGDWHAAAAGIRSSKWAQQTPGRAERMAKALESGAWE